MIDFREVSNGETWEMFGRDFLNELNFFIESAPDRGADLGKDMLVTENLTGRLGVYQFRWLVSCKHNAVSGKSVNEDEERNILERLESFNADGFIGFYSTVPSAGLNSRLHALRAQGKIKDFRFFDHKLIENHLIQVGYSNLVMRYFPESYKSVKPLHQIFNEYVPLHCKVCKKDLLTSLYRDSYSGIVAFVQSQNGKMIQEVYWACKGECDERIENAYWEHERKTTRWLDIGDLIIPKFYLQFIVGKLNTLRNGDAIYTDEAYDQLKYFIIALAQKVLRETSGNEHGRVVTLNDISDMLC